MNLANIVDAFNNTTPTAKSLCVTSSTPILDERSTRTYFDLIASLSAELTITTDERKAMPVLLRRAVAYTVVQNLQDAIEDLTSCLAVDSLSPLPYWQRAACRMKQVNIMISSESRNKEAVDMKLVTIIDDLDRAARLNPECAYVYYNRGVAYSRRDDLDKAIADFDRALALDPNLAEAYYNRGYVYFQLGNHDRGVENLSKAGELGVVPSYSLMKKMSH